jgi:molybdopterin converting factor subunit 1
MKITLFTFGIAREMIGQKQVQVELPNGADTNFLRHYLESEYPGLKGLVKYSIAVNQEYIHENVVISETDELAVIPPVSGG